MIVDRANNITLAILLASKNTRRENGSGDGRLQCDFETSVRRMSGRHFDIRRGGRFWLLDSRLLPPIFGKFTRPS